MAELARILDTGFPSDSQGDYDLLRKYADLPNPASQLYQQMNVLSSERLHLFEVLLAHNGMSIEHIKNDIPKFFRATVVFDGSLYVFSL